MYRKIRLNKHKTMDYHRWLMEQHLGRKLSRYEEVHHIDGNKLNNDISNLMVMDKSEHARLHMKGRQILPPSKEKLRIAGIIARSNSKLTIEQVVQIKRGLFDGKSCTELAKQFPATRHNISQIKRGLRWYWVKI